MASGRYSQPLKGPGGPKLFKEMLKFTLGSQFALLQYRDSLEAFTVFRELQRRYPGQYQDGQLRTFQRRIRVWRGLHGPDAEVFFPQVHEPGKQGQSDFTSMNSLDITLGGLLFPHLLYHFVLPYSNHEYVEISASARASSP